MTAISIKIIGNVVFFIVKEISKFHTIDVCFYQVFQYPALGALSLSSVLFISTNE